MMALGVDHVGSVLLGTEGWRQPRLRETVRTVQQAGRRSCLIPLATDSEIIARALDYYAPDIVHYCEALDDDGGSPRGDAAVHDRQAALRERFPQIAVMRALPIPRRGSPTDSDRVMTRARLFGPVSDYFLTDTLLRDPAGGAPPAQPVDGFIGITGQTCDWTIAARLVSEGSRPVILAGGLAPDNVRQAVLRVGPAGVDSCTLTNRVDAAGRPVRFRKDRTKVEAFVRGARAGVQALQRTEA